MGEAIVTTADAVPEVLPADLAAIFDQSPNPMLVVAVDAPRYTMVAVNAAHLRVFRTTAEALIGRGVFEVFGEAPPPEVQGFVTAIRESFERALGSGGEDQMAVQRAVAPGASGVPEEIWATALHTPIRDDRGRVTHILSCVRNVTVEVRERRASEARALLMREVDHRARNALAVVQSLIRLTDGGDLETYRDAVMGRIEALARAQGALIRGKWEGAPLSDVAQAEVAAIGAPDRFQLAGPDVRLPAQDVQAMSMILHELATNAAKYGALSVPGGRVEIAWTRDASGAICLTWRETDGPPAKAPKRTGFGSRLIRELARQLGGEARKTWAADGMMFELSWTPSETSTLDAEDEALAALGRAGA